MNKKSVILFLSLLFLVGVIFYAWATGTANFNVGFDYADTGSDGLATYGILNWTKGGVNETINFTVRMPANATCDANYSWVIILFGESTHAVHNWHSLVNQTSILTSAFVYDSGVAGVYDEATGALGAYLEEWHCNLTSLGNISGTWEVDTGLEPPLHNLLNWTCYNLSGISQLGANDTLSMIINISANTSIDDELKGVLNYTFQIHETNSSANYTSEYDEVFYFDDQGPRLIEVNISDGNTTYPNNTLGGRILYYDMITIKALIEDTWLNTTVVLAYNCNSSNVTGWLGDGGRGFANEQVLTATNEGMGTFNQKGDIITSSTIDCSDYNLNGGNETLMFAFLANDSFNHYVILNDTSTGGNSINAFNMTLDDGDLLPTITKVNVTQTKISLKDDVTSISRTLDTTSTSTKLNLDGTENYLAANTVTFNIDVLGGYKPANVMIVWNDTGADTTTYGPAVIGGAAAVFPARTHLDESAALNASNCTFGGGETGIDQEASRQNTTIYNVDLSLIGNNSNNFAFWVYANNTGSNYTRISGPWRFQVDGTAPTLTMTPPTDTTINPKNSITYKCTSADSISGVNKIMWELKKPSGTWTKKQNYEAVATDGSDTYIFTGDDTDAAGTYLVRCRAVDIVGNEAIHESTSSETFSVHYSTGGVAAEGPSAAADIDLSTQEEITIKEKQGTISTFTLDGTTIHKITIKEIDEVLGTVTITIESDPITITLAIGETKEVDVDVDGENDISVTLNSITEGVADITTKRLTPLPVTPTEEEVPPTEAPPIEAPEEVPSKTWLWILIIVIIVVIGVGYWFMKKKK